MGTQTDIPLGIPEFYKGKNVLVTGFSGLVGKLVVEKLLYSCPQLSKIYVLVRHKRGKTPQERALEIMSINAFDRVREKTPGALESKVVALDGDLLEVGLGLSAEDTDLLRREVNVVLHIAASVRFDEPLPRAVKTNTEATKNIIDLALTMRHLASLTYMSTAYTNCDHVHIKEKIYPAKACWRETLHIANKVDPAVWAVLEKKYTGNTVNTYIFSKSLAEHICNDHRHLLPVCIIRPSIVSPAWREPVPGFADKLFGTLAQIILHFLGLMRTSIYNTEVRNNEIHSDIVVNATIIASWKTGLTWTRGDGKSMPVYNVCSPEQYMIKTGSIMDEALTNERTREFLESSGLNYISFKPASTEFIYRVHNIYRHVISGYIMDFLLRLLHVKPVLVRVRRKIFQISLQLKLFSTTQFKFDTAQFNGLLESLRPEDKEAFEWNFSKSNIINTFMDWFFSVYSDNGLLKSYFKELETNKTRLRLLYIVDHFVIYSTHALLAYLLYRAACAFVF